MELHTVHHDGETTKDEKLSENELFTIFANWIVLLTKACKRLWANCGAISKWTTLWCVERTQEFQNMSTSECSCESKVKKLADELDNQRENCCSIESFTALALPMITEHVVPVLHQLQEFSWENSKRSFLLHPKTGADATIQACKDSIPNHTELVQCCGHSCFTRQIQTPVVLLPRVEAAKPKSHLVLKLAWRKMWKHVRFCAPWEQNQYHPQVLSEWLVLEVLLVNQKSVFSTDLKHPEANPFSGAPTKIGRMSVSLTSAEFGSQVIALNSTAVATRLQCQNCPFCFTALIMRM